MPSVLDAPLTEVELDRRLDGRRAEFVDGEIVEVQMGWESEWVAMNLAALLWAYCRIHGGWVNGSNASYRCFQEAVPEDPFRIRKPDVSYIAPGRLTRAGMPTGHCDLVPDLVAEVVSPSDQYADVIDKVEEYLRAGVALVWVVEPFTETIAVHRRDGSVSNLRRQDLLSGESVVPGFQCTLAEVFPAADQMETN